jgi:phosphonate transport system permease protein
MAANRNRESLPPLVPPPVAAVASLLVPGLGQALARSVWRGVLLLGSIGVAAAMLVWRVHLLAHLEATFPEMLLKAASRRPLFFFLVLACLAILWLWNTWDAYRLAAVARLTAPARLTARPGFGIFVLVLFTFFVLGWQISEIDVYKMIKQFPEATRPFGRVIWPWKAAVTREPIVVKAGAEIQVPCAQSPPPKPLEEAGQPYLLAEPNCGELSRVDENNQLLPGTRTLLTGRGFRPKTEVQIWWIDPLKNEFRMREAGKYVTLTADSEGAFQLEVTMPYRLVPKSSTGVETHRVEARQVASLGELRASEPLMLVIERMVETIFMGMMATFFGIILSIPVSFLAARNIMSGSWLTMAFYYATRTVLNIIRSIEPLIWAIIAVVWVGLGPFAGIIALTIHSVAALGKLYSEAIEGIDSGPIEAVQATGATRLQTITYAVVPQMIAPFVSFSIYRWDINVRMSTVIGLVGGGGVGFILVQYIRLLDYRAAGLAVWFIAVTVAVLDYVSAEIRARFV